MKVLKDIAVKSSTILVVIIGFALCMLLVSCDEEDSTVLESTNIDNEKLFAEVPNVVGMIASDATNTLREAGFKSIDCESDTGEMVIVKSNWIVVAQNPEAARSISLSDTVILNVERKETENQVAKAKDESSGSDNNRASIDILKLQVSRYEESEMDGADSYHIYSNVGASETNLAAFRDDCIIGVAYAFSLPINEATTYVDRSLAGESRVVIEDKILLVHTNI